MILVTARLEAWQDLGGSLSGYIFDDVKQRFSNGTFVYTSSIQGTHTTLKEGDIVQTRNSLYHLGRPYYEPKTVG